MKKIGSIVILAILAGFAFIRFNSTTDEERVMEIVQEETTSPMELREREAMDPPPPEPEPAQSDEASITVAVESSKADDGLATEGTELSDAEPVNRESDDTSTLGDIMTTLSEYFTASFTDDSAKATTVTHPNSAVAQQIDDLRKVGFNGEEVLVEVIADEAHALAISEGVTGGTFRQGYLLFFFSKDEQGSWLIDDIDFETAESRDGEVETFMAEYPESTYLFQFAE